MLNKLRLGWQQPGWLNYLMYPVSLLYLFLINLKYWFYRIGLLKYEKFSVPVIVVGNISVGGTGKTPLVMALVEYFLTMGKKPGVISRGYKAELLVGSPKIVTKGDTAREVGDEPLLIYQQCHVPVAVGPNRAANGKLLIEKSNCNILISDDGFQHFAVKRDIDIVVIDGDMGFGNGWCLPAGPLRELPSALPRADVVIVNGGQVDVKHTKKYSMSYTLSEILQINGDHIGRIDQFRGKQVHAIAGIGNPNRFFQQLSQTGIDVLEHAFEDHHKFQMSDLKFNDDLPIFMTQKDAVKCRSLIASAPSNFWSVPIKLEIDAGFFEFIERKIF